jgi:hypothetical protein
MMTEEKLIAGGMGETQTMAVLKDAQDMYMLKKGVVSTYEQWDKRSSNSTSKDARVELGKEEKYALGNGGKDETQMQQPL